MGYIIALAVLAAVVLFFRWCHKQREKTYDPYKEEREPPSGIETLVFLLVARKVGCWLMLLILFGSVFVLLKLGLLPK